MPCHPWTALQNWFYRTTYIWPCWPIKLQYINYISISHSLKTKYLLFHLPFIWYVHQVQTIHLDNSICYLRRHKFSSAIFPFKKKAWPRQHIRKKRKKNLIKLISINLLLISHLSLHTHWVKCLERWAQVPCHWEMDSNIVENNAGV